MRRMTEVFSLITTKAGTASTRLIYATPIETVAIGSDATGDRGILFDQHLGHTCD